MNSDVRSSDLAITKLFRELSTNMYRIIKKSIFKYQFYDLKFHHYYIYILKCSDGTYYTGITNQLERRLAEHQSGDSKSSSTFKRRPLSLVFYTEFNNVEFAIEKEKQIKKWSTKKKEALINGAFDDLKNLARKNFAR